MLLVEDSATDIFVIREVLGTSGLNLQVDVAKNGQEALRYLLESTPENCPALVLLDLNIPKINGLEVLRGLRDGSICQRIPVVVVSSSRAEEDRNRAKQLGADEYFLKPADLESYNELAEVVQRVLDRTKRKSNG